MKKTTLIAAMLMGMVASGVAQGTSNPSTCGWHLNWNAEGEMQGNYDVGIRTKGSTQSPNPISYPPPQYQGCPTEWHWKMWANGTSAFGPDCASGMLTSYEIVVSPHGTNNWQIAGGFNFGQIAPGCCDLCPEANCTGEYTANFNYCHP